MRVRHLILSAMAGFILASCQDLKLGDAFLEKAPSSEVDINTIYGDAVYARRALWAAYRTLPYGLPTDQGTCMQDDMLECLTDLNHSYLGYSYNGSGSTIPAYSPLVFEIEIVEEPED